MNHREIDQSKNDICIWNLHIEFLHQVLSDETDKWNECVNVINEIMKQKLLSA